MKLVVALVNPMFEVMHLVDQLEAPLEN